MFKRDVFGWRVLAVLFAVLVFSTFSQFDSISREWKESIEGDSTDEELEEIEAEPPAQQDVGETSDDEPSEEDDSQDAEIATLEEADVPDTESIEDSTPTNNQSMPHWVLPSTQIIALTIMGLMAVGLLTSTTIAIFSSEAARFSILLAIIGPIVAITQRGEGGVFTRGRILGFIEAHPGIHFSALRDALMIGNGVTSHHIQILEREGRIISWVDGKVRRFASSGIDQDRLREIKSPVVGMQIAILQILLEHENLGIKSGDLREKLETSRQLLSYHMKQLSEREFVESTGKGRALRWNLLEEGKKQLRNSKHLMLVADD